MLKLRVITSVVALVVIGVVLFVIPPNYAELLVGLLLVAGAWEWSGFLDLSNTVLRGLYTAIVGACLAAVYFVVPEMTGTILLVATAWWSVAFLWTFFYPTPIPLPVRWICGLLVIVPLFAALVLLFRLGVDYLLFTLLIVWVADGGAYFAGKQFGRVKLAPAISPGKTWEGVIGGLVLVSALAVGVGLCRDLNIGVFLPFCLAVAALSVVGDLTVSMFKRTAGVKDSGSLFPGHGGVLDRIDSVAAAAPLFALGLGWLGLV
jgi:phosphatidate cytidylyltransferase